MKTAAVERRERVLVELEGDRHHRVRGAVLERDGGGAGRVIAVMGQFSKMPT